MLSVNKLYKYYGINSGNLGMSFNLEEGKIFVVYGPKDSGKTLLLKQLANIIKPDVGEIKIYNHSYKEIKNFNDNISTYFYTDDFWSRMKIKDYLSLLIKERDYKPEFIFKKEKKHHEDESDDLEEILKAEKVKLKTKPKNKLTKEEKEAAKKQEKIAKQTEKLQKEKLKQQQKEEKKLKQIEAQKIAKERAKQKAIAKKERKKLDSKSKNSSNEIYVKKFLDFFNINPKMMICNISPEQRRVLLLIVSIMNKEKLILIDDFGVEMNEDTRSFFKERFKELAKEGRMIIITSKQKDSLNDIASKIMYINKGKILDILSRG